jgi:hypothetical protein
LLSLLVPVRSYISFSVTLMLPFTNITQFLLIVILSTCICVYSSLLLSYQPRDCIQTMC